ncbi:MAG: HYR domain-containing protein [Verrucomicrobiota bacterium]
MAAGAILGSESILDPPDPATVSNTIAIARASRQHGVARAIAVPQALKCGGWVEATKPTMGGVDGEETSIAFASFEDTVVMASDSSSGAGELTMKWTIEGGWVLRGVGHFDYGAYGRATFQGVPHFFGVSGSCQSAVTNAGDLGTDYYVTIPFVWNQPLTISGELSVTGAGSSWRIGLEDMSYFVTCDAGNTLAYKGLVAVRDSFGQLTTNYTITAASGTDWTKPYTPDPSPTLTQAIASNGSVRVLGSLQAHSNETYVLTFEVPQDCSMSLPPFDLSLGQRTVITDGAGHVSFDFLFPTNLTLPALVRATATDAATNTSPRSACIPISDEQPPTISCPSSFAVPSLDTNGAIVAFAVPATDNTPSNLSVVCVPPSGTVFPLGLTTVNCTATDAAGNTSHCSFEVTVNLQPAVEWVGNSGDWSNPANWSTGVVPGPADFVVIDRPGDLTITHSAGDDVVAAIICRENFMLSGGSLSFANSARFEGTLSLSGGTLTGSGDVSITGVLNWTGGTMTGTGKTIVPSGATLTMSGGTLGRELRNYGTATWNGSWMMAGGIINNYGAANVNGGYCDGIGGVNAFNNLPGATLTKVGGDTLQFRPNGSAMPLNNFGTVNVQAGTLSLAGGGTNTGNVRITQGVLKVLVGGMDFPNAAVLQSEPGGTFQLSDGGLSGTTTNKIQFMPKGRLLIDGSGARQLEVMSWDLGNVSAGYNTNYAYGTLQLGGNVNLSLVDNSDNNPGTEALYLDSLIIPAGTTLDLAGLHVYVRSMQIAGNVTGGTIALTPPELSLATGGNGSLTLTWPASYSAFVLESTGSLAPADWQPVTTGITENGGIKSYTVVGDPNVSGRLYRLRLP